MVCITKDALSTSGYSNLYEVTKGLNISKRDIATIVDIFSTFLKNNTSDDVESIYTDGEGHFVVLLNANGAKSDFDFFDFLNNIYSDEKGVTINCINVKQLFPSSMSCGEFVPREIGYDADADSTNSIDDEATGYMDESELVQLQGRNYTLVYLKTGSEVKLSERPISIGRSSKYADFVIHGNNKVSRKHCILYVNNGRIFIKDNKSVNGTYINDTKLHELVEVEIHVGDTLYIADEKFVVK